ncbi:MAG TPA: DUF4831 family protein [Bacteroidales bacterium]|nr:DUF4831 family protein [Bacteroidales bacterium]
MKTIARLTLLLVAVYLVSSCSSTRNIAGQAVITPLSGTSVVKDGSIVYALPRTVFTVVVEMDRTIEIPGPYARYASDMLGLDNVIKNENESWSIDNVNVKTSEELDPSEFYVIKSEGLFQSDVLKLKKEGLILDLNPDIYASAGNRSEALGSAAGQYRSYDLGSDEYFRLQRDTAYKRVSLDSSFIRIPYIVEKMRKLSVDQLAEKAAKRLMELRDGKHMILTGEANVFPQSEASINEINRLEKQYTELFTGRTITEKRLFTYHVIPSKDMLGKPVTIFRFSDLTGPVAGTDKGGKPVTVVFTPEQKTKALTVLNNTTDSRDSQEYDKLYYRVPDVADMKIILEGDVLFNSRRLVYQFGQVIQLPANYILGQ